MFPGMRRAILLILVLVGSTWAGACARYHTQGLSATRTITVTVIPR